MIKYQVILIPDNPYMDIDTSYGIYDTIEEAKKEITRSGKTQVICGVKWTYEIQEVNCIKTITYGRA